MAGGLTAGAADELLASAEFSAYRYVQLHTGSPGAAGTGNVAGETTRKQATLAAAGSAQVANTAALVWDPYAATEIVTHASGWDASSGGSCGWTSDEFTNPVGERTLTAGDRFTIAIGDLTISFPTAS